MDVSDREHEILGAPQRIESSTSEVVRREAQERTARLREAVMGITTRPEDVDVPEMVLAMMCHPDLTDSLTSLAVQLIGRPVLPHRLRELALLRTSWLCGAPYEFGEHVRLATLLFDVSNDEIAQIKAGSGDVAWGRLDRAVLRAAEELHERATISDETWGLLAADLDDAQLFELTVVIGQATMVAYFQNAGRFRLAPHNDGLRAG